MDTNISRRLIPLLIAAAVGTWALTSCGQSVMSSGQRSLRPRQSSSAQSARTADVIDPVAGFGGSGRDLWATTPTGALYLTTSGGRSWLRRTPPVSLAGLAADGHSYDVAQWGSSLVWLVAPDHHAETLFESDNDGRTWYRHVRVASVPIPSYARSAVAEVQVYAQLLSSRAGFVVLDGFMTATGGFWTLDATTTSGASFRTTLLPTFGPVQFRSATEGFLAGGPGGQGLYVTRDGSASWQRLSVTPPVPADWGVGFPLWQGPTAVIAPVTAVPVGGVTELYLMRVSLAAPHPSARSVGPPLRVGGSSEAVATTGERNTFFAEAPNGSHVYVSTNSGRTWTTSASRGLPAGVMSVVYTAPGSAVAEVANVTCIHKSNCVSETGLFATTNDGSLWRPMDF